VDYLEQLVSEWYEYQGYFVRRDLWVGLESDGSYECELDVVAYHPTKHHLVQIEPSLAIFDWEEQESHFRLKFDAGQKYLHRFFGGEPSPGLEQIALVLFMDVEHRDTVAGGRVVHVRELLAEIFQALVSFGISSYLIPEQWPLLRTLQLVAEFRDTLSESLSKRR